MQDLAIFLKRHDPDRYFLSMFAPVNHRAALWALGAFNYEIAKTREVVSETQLGLIRLQWWQDALEEIYQGLKPRAHEIVEPLAEVIKSYQLVHEDFKNTIYGREFDLEDMAPASIEGLFQYARITHGPFIQLHSKVLEDTEDTQRLAVYYALIGVLRSIPYHHAQARYYIPQDLTAKYGLKLSRMHEADEQQKLKLCVANICEAIQMPQKPRNRYFKAMYSLAKSHHLTLQKADYDPFLAENMAHKRKLFTVLRVISGI